MRRSASSYPRKVLEIGNRVDTLNPAAFARSGRSSRADRVLRCRCHLCLLRLGADCARDESAEVAGKLHRSISLSNSPRAIRSSPCCEPVVTQSGWFELSMPRERRLPTTASTSAPCPLVGPIASLIGPSRITGPKFQQLTMGMFEAGPPAASEYTSRLPSTCEFADGVGCRRRPNTDSIRRSRFQFHMQSHRQPFTSNSTADTLGSLDPLIFGYRLV